MNQKIKLDDKEYDVENLSDHAQATLTSMQFATKRVQELDNMRAVLQRAKISYIESLKKEVLSNKAGFLFGEE